MTRTTKMLTITLISATVLGASGYVGFRKFARSVYDQRTCEWANIDNIEMHTHIDIPAITTSDCRYLKEQNRKTARFDLDKSKVDMGRYIQSNHFIKLPPEATTLFDELLQKGIDKGALTDAANLYYVKGSHESENWLALLDHSTGKLWVTIQYQD